MALCFDSGLLKCVLFNVLTFLGIVQSKTVWYNVMNRVLRSITRVIVRISVLHVLVRCFIARLNQILAYKMCLFGQECVLTIYCFRRAFRMTTSWWPNNPGSYCLINWLRLTGQDPSICDGNAIFCNRIYFLWQRVQLPDSVLTEICNQWRSEVGQ